MTANRIIRFDPARVLFLGTALLSMWVIVGYDYGQIALWPDIEANLSALMLVTGSVGAMWCGLEWQMVWRGVEAYVPYKSISPGPQPWVNWLSTSAWLIAGVVIGAGVGVFSIRSSVAGEPNAALALGWLAAIIAACSVGSAIGRFTPRYIGPLLTGLIMYLGVGSVMYGTQAARQLLPLADGYPPIGFAYGTGYLVVQAAFLLAVAALAVAVAASARGLLRKRWMLANGVVLLLLGLAAVNMTAAVAVPVPYDCQTGSVRVCAPEDLLIAAHDIDSVVEVFERMTSNDVKEIRIEEGPDTYDPVTGNGKLSVGGVRVNASLLTAEILLVSNRRACPNGDASYLVVEGLAYLASTDPMQVSQLGRRVSEALEQDPSWLSSHWKSIRACALPLDELPGI